MSFIQSAMVGQSEGLKKRLIWLIFLGGYLCVCLSLCVIECLYVCVCDVARAYLCVYVCVCK